MPHSSTIWGQAQKMSDVGKPSKRRDQRSRKQPPYPHTLVKSEVTEPIGGFPNEIKTKIRYLIICCYDNFILWKYDNNK